MPRVILVASKTGYQVREFYAAARKLGIDLVLATDRCHVLDDPWGDQAAPLNFDDPREGIAGLAARGPFDGIVAVGDKPACVAAEVAEALGLRFHSLPAATAAADKFATRQRFCAAGMRAPAFAIMASGAGAQPPGYPCVAKPLHLSGSRGVIRADNPREFAEACARVRAISREPEILVEEFIPGREFALEGVVAAGELRTLAIFDKPDPLDGPFFEETIYVTPSREPAEVQNAIEAATQQAVQALGLSHGSVHAEMRVNRNGVWMLEAAARPIGGLCSRLLRFQDDQTLEEILLRHSLGIDSSRARLLPGAHGVMMIPIPQAGIYDGVEGMQEAAGTADIQAIEITAKEGQYMEPLPEGASYLGFLFSRANSPADAEIALRRAHSRLRFRIARALPVVR